MRPTYICANCLIRLRQYSPPVYRCNDIPFAEFAGTKASSVLRGTFHYPRLLFKQQSTSARHNGHAAVEPFKEEESQTSVVRRVKSRKDYSTAATSSNAPDITISPDASLAAAGWSKVRGRLNQSLYSCDGPSESLTLEQALTRIGPDLFQDDDAELAEQLRRLGSHLEKHFGQEDFTKARDQVDGFMAWRISSKAERRAILRDDPDIANHLLGLGIAEGSITKAKSDEPRIALGRDEEDEVPLASFLPLKVPERGFQPVDTGPVNVPSLSFDLSRVLFNPGVYQLQDPRSRVYNFDPYLEKIMPVSEFNYDALNEYVTTSKDHVLRELAIKQRKRYTGSSSSMTSVLAHLHFLLSSWRSLDVSMISRGFNAESDNFTRFQRAPAAVFLRHQDGVYAMDADKEFDDVSTLLNLGRSMEKLLTMEKGDFEKLRRSNDESGDASAIAPEQYHYSELGPFLMRSQLDAHDPRLPGTGMFDLKTRAVVSVRMMMSDERAMGYEIKSRNGSFESFEREYYDMIRAAFLKYSLQARMGRMDGVFVTYHNIARIFGFQYISLAEMDQTLHGQDGRTLGDQEFQYSVLLVSKIFDRAIKAFPKESLRFHFETRESTSTKTDKRPWMYVFAEPVEDSEIDRIQSARHDENRAAQERILSGKMSRGKVEANSESNAGDTDFLDGLQTVSVKPVADKTLTPGNASGLKKRLLGMKVSVNHRVDGSKTTRPVRLTRDQLWEMDYSIAEMSQQAAEAHYTACKVRRSNMAQSMRDNDAAAVGYLSKLMAMSEAGVAWRKKRDEKDAARERVVLYQKGEGHLRMDE